INVTPLPEISVGIKHDTLICEGEALLLPAETNPEAKAAVTWIKTTDGSGTEPIQPGPYVMYENATITAIATNLCGSSKPASFKVRIGKRPAISFTPSDIVRDCPYTPVSLTGNGGDKYVYRLYDLRAHQAATPPQFGAQTGLQDYPLQLHDSLALVYEAENHLTGTGFQPASLICSASDTALIVAYPLPPVKIAYDGQSPADDGTLCVPRDRSFNLVASGSDTYMWQNDPTKSGANHRLTLTQDETIQVRGTERAHGCHADFTVQCVISVEHADRIKDATVCPDENVCFEADLLPDTKYAWSNPQGTDLNHSAERFCFNPTADPGQTGTYTLTTERKGCREVLTYELTFHPYPTPQIITKSPEVCEGSNVVLQVYSGMSEAEEKRATYRWEKADGAFISDRPNFWIPGISTGDAGLYRAIVTSQAGCQGQDDITLTVGMHITPDFQIATSYCEDEETTLTASPAGSGYIYRWFTDSRVIPTDETVPTAKIAWQRNDNGTLYLEIQQTGCTDTAFRPLTVIPRPHLSGLPQDTGLCTEMPLCLNPVADLTPDKVIWYFIDANGTKTVLRQDANPDLTYCWNQVDALQNGLYYLDVSHQGCLSVSDTVRLTVYPLPDIRIDGPAFICDGDTVTLAAVSNTQGSNRWSPSGQTTEAIRITEAGRYAVTRTSEYGCADSADIRLEARPLPYFTLPADTSLCRGTSFMIYGPDGMDAYVWHDGLEEKDRLAEDEGWYILTAFRNECGFSDSLYVHLTFCGQFHFPTAFTPNDNRINDTWGAISAAKEEDMAEYDLMVFDRNGKKVFHGKRISEQWDGKYKGQLCPPGVYTYSFRALEKEEGIKYQSSGTVTIVL
ncbi:MAG: gliding motility-associated C-terminal domain-containing protein, partial [Bacteroidales bacterium]|nr:gliding motility-associated C-terminal domain-containing protein [Bacteroidales bacterium]